VEQARFKNKRLKRRSERLEQDLEKACRAVHRQAAPFSKGETKAEPKTFHVVHGQAEICGQLDRRIVDAASRVAFLIVQNIVPQLFVSIHIV